MRPGTEARTNVYGVPIIVVALMTFLLIDAVGSSDSQVNSGQGRDLMNQEPCWTPENPDDISRCELDD
jgi:hypothetical protein